MVSRRKKDKKKRFKKKLDNYFERREWFEHCNTPYENTWQAEFDRIKRDGQFCGCCGERLGTDRHIAAHVCGKIVCSYCAEHRKNKVKELLEEWETNGGHILMGGTY